MKSIISLLGLVAVNLAVSTSAEPTPATANRTNWFKVSGMHCNGCAGGIRSELRRTAGVADVTVSFTNQLAMVAFDTNRVSAKQLIKVIEEAGYGARRLKP